MTGELEAMRQQLQSLADTLVGDFDGEHDASAAVIAKASDMMLTLQATVERQAAEIARKDAALTWILDHYANQEMNHVDFRVGAAQRARQALGDHNG
jgi:hypothetical protein